eukprot:jgi/Mesvir1/5398/Mv15471-RA.1
MSNPRITTRVRVPPRLGIVGSQVSGEADARDACSPNDANGVAGTGGREDDRPALDEHHGEAGSGVDRETDASTPAGTLHSRGRSPSPPRTRASTASPTMDAGEPGENHAKSSRASHQVRAPALPHGVGPPLWGDRAPPDSHRPLGVSPRVKDKPRVEDPHAARKERLREMETWTLLSSRMQALDRHLGDALVQRHAFSSSLRFAGGKPTGSEWEPSHRAGSPQPPPALQPQHPRQRSCSDAGGGGTPDLPAAEGDTALGGIKGPPAGQPPAAGTPKGPRLHARTTVPITSGGGESLAEAARLDADGAAGGTARTSVNGSGGGAGEPLLSPLRFHGALAGGMRPGSNAWAEPSTEGTPGGPTAPGAAAPISPGGAPLLMLQRGSAMGWTAPPAMAALSTSGSNAGGATAPTSQASPPQVPRLKMPQLPRVTVPATVGGGRDVVGSPQTARPRLQSGGADAGDPLFPTSFSSVASLRGGGGMWKAGTDAPGLAWIQRLVGYIDRHPLSEVLAAYEQGLSPPRPDSSGAGSLYLDAHAAAPTRGDVAAVEGWLQQVLADAALAKLPGAVVRDAKGAGTYLGLQGERGAELAECALTMHRNAFQEICHQVTLHCRERGQLLQSVWQQYCTLLEVKLRLAYDDEVHRLHALAQECQQNVRMGQQLLDAKVAEMREEMEASSHREKLLEREKRKLTQHLIKWEAEARAESHQFEAVNEEMKDVMRQLRDANDRVQELQDELAAEQDKQRLALSAQADQMATLQGAMDATVADLAAANRQVEEGKAAYDKVTSQFKRVAMERALLEVEFRAETQRLVESQARADKLEEDLEMMRNDASRLSALLAARDAELAQQTHRAQVAEKLAEGRLCEVEAGHERVVAAERMYAKMRAECEEMRRTYGQLEEQRTDAMTKLAEATERCEAAVRESERCRLDESAARADAENMARQWQEASHARDRLGLEVAQLKRQVHTLFTQMAEWGKQRGLQVQEEVEDTDDEAEEGAAEGDPTNDPAWQKLGPGGAGQQAMARLEQMMSRVMAESEEAARSVANMKKRMEVMEKSKDNIQEQMSLYRNQYEEACARLKARDNLAYGAEESLSSLRELLAQAANNAAVATAAKKALEAEKRDLERSVEALRFQLQNAERAGPEVQKIKMQLTVEKAQHGAKKLENRRLMQTAEADAERISQLSQAAQEAEKEAADLRAKLAACKVELASSKRAAIEMRVASHTDASLTEWKEHATRYRSQVGMLWERMQVMAKLAPSAHLFLNGLEAVLETVEGRPKQEDGAPTSPKQEDGAPTSPKQEDGAPTSPKQEDGGAAQAPPEDAISLALKVHKGNADLIAKAFLHAIPIVQRIQEGKRDPRSVPLLRFRIAGLEVIRQALRRGWMDSAVHGAHADLLVRELHVHAADTLAATAQEAREVVRAAMEALGALRGQLTEVGAYVVEAGAQAVAHVGEQRRRLTGQLAQARAEIRAWEAKLINRVDVGIQRSECIGGNLMWESFREQLQLREAAGTTAAPQAKKLVLKSIVHIYDGWIAAEEKRVKAALAGHKPPKRLDVYQTMMGVFTKVFGNYAGSPAMENMELFLTSCRAYEGDAKVAMFTRFCGLSSSSSDGSLEADFFFVGELLYCIKALMSAAAWGELTDAWSKGAAYLPAWMVLNVLGNVYYEDKPASLPIYANKLAPAMVEREAGRVLALDTLLQAAVEENDAKIFPVKYFMAPRIIVSPASITT